MKIKQLQEAKMLSDSMLAKVSIATYVRACMRVCVCVCVRLRACVRAHVSMCVYKYFCAFTYLSMCIIRGPVKSNAAQWFNSD